MISMKSPTFIIQTLKTYEQTGVKKQNFAFNVTINIYSEIIFPQQKLFTDPLDLIH